MARDRIITRVHSSLNKSHSFSFKPALLIDRDGVLVQEKHYLSRPQDVVLERGVVDLLRKMQMISIPVCVITNQSGIDRGLFDVTAFEAVSDRIDTLLAEEGVRVDVTICCPFHPDFTLNFSKDHAWLRKLGGCMFEILADQYEITLRRSVMIGDNVTDIEAARNAGLDYSIHLLTGQGSRFREKVVALRSANFAVDTFNDLSDANSTIEKHFLQLELSKK